jgi:hypothetical protein
MTYNSIERVSTNADIIFIIILLLVMVRGFQFQRKKIKIRILSHVLVMTVNSIERGQGSPANDDIIFTIILLLVMVRELSISTQKNVKRDSRALCHVSS